jgi:type IV secretion system protein VirD4
MRVLLRRKGGPATLAHLHALAAENGGGAFLARNLERRYLYAPPNVAVLILAGPQAGKSVAVVMPGVAMHPGPVVCTSTKLEIAHRTAPARREIGECWMIDLAGAGVPDGFRELRWSPLQRADTYANARLVARMMAGAVPVSPNGRHWMNRAGDLLACCLLAAHRGGADVRRVVTWILSENFEVPRETLEASRGSHPDDALAHAELVGLDTQAREERARVVSNCTEIIDAYKDSTALATAEQPNFDPHRFIDTVDTIYVAAPNEAQDKLAPIVVGLLSHIRAAVYARGRTDDPPVLFMLDECANIARLPDLPAMLSEAGGQGLQTVCVFQDISQVRRLWAADADGFLSLFHSKVVLRGIADMRTLDQLSLLCGEYDRNIKTESHRRPAGGLFAPAAPATRTTSFTTRRERIVPPDRIAAIQLGEALVIRATEWEFVPTTPYDEQPVLKELTNGHQ